MNGPELSPQDERELDRLVELQISTAIEEKRLREVMRGCTEGLCEEYE